MFSFNCSIEISTSKHCFSRWFLEGWLRTPPPKIAFFVPFRFSKLTCCTKICQENKACPAKFSMWPIAAAAAVSVGEHFALIDIWYTVNFLSIWIVFLCQYTTCSAFPTSFLFKTCQTKLYGRRLCNYLEVLTSFKQLLLLIHAPIDFCTNYIIFHQI